MNVYPHNSALILTDNIFVSYGGQTGTMTPAQRSAAYLIAEKQATKYIGTFLLPTIVTGTYQFNKKDWRISTDYGYVHSVLSVHVLSKDNLDTCTLDEETACVFVADDTFGYLDVSCVNNYCNCGASLYPYQFRVAYQAGLPTGTANQPDVLLALTMAAQITLNEMQYPSQNESMGDVGVEQFSVINQYSEKRKAMKRTAFGNSAKAQKIAQLLDGAVYKARKAIIMK